MSEISLIRIDDRLIHGQVMTRWIKHVETTTILIIDDDLVNDDFMVSVLEVSVPKGISLKVVDVSSAITTLSTDADNEKYLILTKGPNPLLKLVQNNIPLKNIILGGMGVSNIRKNFYRNLAASEEEMASFKTLIQSGICIEIQAIPSDKAVNLSSIIK